MKQWRETYRRKPHNEELKRMDGGRSKKKVIISKG